MEYKDIDFYAPEGLELSPDDTYRKFGNMLVLGRIKGELPKDEDSIQIIQLGGFTATTIRYYTDGGVNLVSGNRRTVRLAAAYPSSNLTNYRNGVLRGWRTGERQWNLGLGGAGYVAVYENGDQTRHIEIGWEAAQALFYPTYSTVKEALELLNSKKAMARAINHNFWIKRIDISVKEAQHVLFRKTIPLGVFTSANPKSFYAQSGCDIFKPDVQKLLEV